MKGLKVKVNMDVVNTVLLVVILALVVYCLVKQNERFNNNGETTAAGTTAAGTTSAGNNANNGNNLDALRAMMNKHMSNQSLHLMGNGANNMNKRDEPAPGNNN